jgi:glycine betaine catabolism A
MRGHGVSVTALTPALPKHMYVDESFWRLERDRVLHGSWFCVGRLDDLGVDRPGRLAVVDVVGESVLVTCDLRGDLHAAYNVCRHRGSQIVPVEPADGPPPGCAVGALRCPYHSWTYDLAGRLLRAPHTEGVTAFDSDEFGLHPVAVEAWAGFCFVHLTPAEARPLAAEIEGAVAGIARYPIGSLVRGLRLEYDVAANYKVLSENYNECYHCGPVHPELSRLVPSFGSGGSGLDWDAGVEHRQGAWTFTMSGTTTRRAFPGLDETELSRHKGALLHPNLWLSCSPDHVAAFTLWPLDVGRTRVVCDLLFEPDAVAADDFDPADAGDLWDLVNRQDWAVCESVQRGMGSRAYEQGWFAPMEDLAADIRRWLLPRLDKEVGA